jgi:transcriptional regulator with XRE-family HTH domain
MTAASLSPFGRLLRHWRHARGASQLALSVEAGVSSRHLSFVETGRAQPSREMVLRLAEALDVPLRERNALLAAAGYAAVFRETPLDAPALAPVKRMIDFLLARAEPFPAFLVDRCFRLLAANQGAAKSLGRFVGPGAVWQEQPLNLARVTLAPDGLRPFVVNFDEVAAAMLARVERAAALASADDDLARLRDDLFALPALPRPSQLPAAVAPVLPLHLKRDGFEARLFSMLTTIGAPLDVTAAELHIECFMPADDASEEVLRAL